MKADRAVRTVLGLTKKVNREMAKTESVLDSVLGLLKSIGKERRIKLVVVGNTGRSAHRRRRLRRSRKRK